VSLAGRIRTRGVRGNVYRPTIGANADGTRKVTSYGTAVLSGVRVLFDGITDEMVQKVFGGSPLVKTRGFMLGAPDVRDEDRFTPTGGAFAGRVFRVESIRPQYGRHSAHFELALESTTETIP
jgi:hypothetical protein